MLEIYLVRHGTAENPDGVEYRRRPGFPLSERGVKEIEQAARFLRGRAIEAVFHSPLERCAQSASIIVSALGVPAIVSREINEWDEKESLRDVQARMNTFYMTLYAQAYEKMAVVSHRDTLRVLMLSLAGGKLSGIYKPDVFPIEPGGVYFLNPGPGQTSIEKVFAPVADPE